MSQDAPCKVVPLAMAVPTQAQPRHKHRTQASTSHIMSLKPMPFFVIMAGRWMRSCFVRLARSSDACALNRYSSPACPGWGERAAAMLAKHSRRCKQAATCAHCALCEGSTRSAWRLHAVVQCRVHTPWPGDAACEQCKRCWQHRHGLTLVQTACAAPHLQPGQPRGCH